LDNQNQLIANETVFIFTIIIVEIYSQEIFRQTLKCNAVRLILTQTIHNDY